LKVPFEGFEDGLTERLCLSDVKPSQFGAVSFLPAQGIIRVSDPFFKRQIEECQELARHSVDEKDRAFWQQAAARWEEQLRKVQQIHPLSTSSQAHLASTNA
jgi:hypothetical protein